MTSGSPGTGCAGALISTASASAMARAVSSLLTRISASGRSKRRAQIWNPSATLMSRALMRTVPLARRTEPSTTTWTSSSRPTSRRSRSRAL